LKNIFPSSTMLFNSVEKGFLRFFLLSLHDKLAEVFQAETQKHRSVPIKIPDKDIESQLVIGMGIAY